MKLAEQIYYDGCDGKYNLNALIKADKTGEYIYKAEEFWNKFDYEKSLKVLKQIGGEWYDKALKNWPKGIKQSQAKIKQLEKTSKKLPMKKLKLENVEKTATEIYNNGFEGKYDLDALIKVDKAGGCIYRAGINWEKFDFDKGLNGLMKADKKGCYIYDAGVNWKKFDYNKGLSVLIKIDKTGEWIYNAGIDWKKFDYNKAIKILKQKDKYYYKEALRDWPKGIEQSQAKIKEMEKTSKKLKGKPLKLKEEYTEIQYLNTAFFKDLKKIFRAVKKAENPDKKKKMGFYLQLARKVQGNKENIEQIIKDCFKGKQELSPNELMNEIRNFESPAGKKLYIRPETAYQTTQRLVSSAKLNKTISVSIFGEIYNKTLDKFKNKPGGDNVIRAINRYIAGHFDDAAAFIRWTNMSPKWIHLDAFQTDFFSKLKAMGNKDPEFKNVADELRSKENEFWKTAMSYIVRTNPNVRVWTANTEELVKQIENVRGEVKLKQYYHKLPKLFGFKLIKMERLYKILGTRPGVKTDALIKKFGSAIKKYTKAKKASIGDEHYNRIIYDIAMTLEKIASTNKKAGKKTDKPQIDATIRGYSENDFLASAFHQHLDKIHEIVNRGKETELKNYLKSIKNKIKVFLKEKSKGVESANIWWSDRSMLFEREKYLKINFIIENLSREILK